MARAGESWDSSGQKRDHRSLVLLLPLHRKIRSLLTEDADDMVSKTITRSGVEIERGINTKFPQVTNFFWESTAGGDDSIRGQGGELKDALGHSPTLRDDTLARLNDLIEFIVPSGMGVFGSLNLLDEFLEPGFVLIVQVKIFGNDDRVSGRGWSQGGLLCQGTPAPWAANSSG